MPQPERITSLQNPRVKQLLRLRDRRDRDESGLTLIEEPRVIRRALAAGYPFREVWFCEELLAQHDPGLMPLLRGKDRDKEPAAATSATSAPPAGAPAHALELVEVTPAVMAKVAYKDRPEGILVVAPQVRRTLAGLTLSASPLLIVLEGVEKPGNLGAILRIADGAGADGVIVCDPGTDVFNPNVLRASVGAFFTVPVVEEDAAVVRRWLREQRILSVATTPAAVEPYTAVDLRGAVAILLGAEDTGLSEEWLAAADSRVRIPMRGEVDSLNVGISAALVAYEAVRQRGLR